MEACRGRKRIRCRSAVLVPPAVELDDNIAVYDEVGQLMILLNASAGAVWNLCDGSTTVDEMISELTETYPDQAAVIGDDVRQTLRKLAELGLVSAGPAGSRARTSAGPSRETPPTGVAQAGGRCPG